MCMKIIWNGPTHYTPFTSSNYCFLYIYKSYFFLYIIQKKLIDAFILKSLKKNLHLPVIKSTYGEDYLLLN